LQLLEEEVVEVPVSVEQDVATHMDTDEVTNNLSATDGDTNMQGNADDLSSSGSINGAPGSKKEPMETDKVKLLYGITQMCAIYSA
jgi:hypothetical protein